MIASEKDVSDRLSSLGYVVKDVVNMGQGKFWATVASECEQYDRTTKPGTFSEWAEDPAEFDRRFTKWSSSV